MKKYVIFILSINLLLTSCTLNDDKESLIKEKNQLSSSSDVANKYIKELENKIDGSNATSNDVVYKLEDYEGLWLVDDPSKNGVYIDEHVIMDILNGEINSWGFISDYKIYENQLIVEKQMIKIDGEYVYEDSEHNEPYLYDAYIIGKRNDRSFVNNSLDVKKEISYYKGEGDIGEDISKEIQGYDIGWYREFYGTKYDYLLY